MQRRIASFRLPVVAQDVLLALFITVLQVQGTLNREPFQIASRSLTEFGNLGYVLLIVSGVVVAVRRRWPVTASVVVAINEEVFCRLSRFCRTPAESVMFEAMILTFWSLPYWPSGLLAAA